MLIKNHLVYLQARGKIGFSSKCPVEPAHAVNPFTSFCREVVSSAEKGTGGYYVLWGSLGTEWRCLGAGSRLQLPSLVSPVLFCFLLTAINHRDLMNGDQHRGDLSQSLQPPAQQRPAVIEMQSRGASLLLCKPFLNLLINQIWWNSFSLWGKKIILIIFKGSPCSLGL